MHALLRGVTGGIDCVLDADGAVLAGPSELRSFRARSILAASVVQGHAVVDLGNIVATVRRVSDPDKPWYLVHLAPALDTRPPALGMLTARQLEVARLAALGRKNDEIACALGCSPNTVRTHLRAIYERLAVCNRVELTLALGEG